MTSTLGVLTHLLWRKLGEVLQVKHGKELTGQEAEKSWGAYDNHSWDSKSYRQPREWAGRCLQTTTDNFNRWNLKPEDLRVHLSHTRIPRLKTCVKNVPCWVWNSSLSVNRTNILWYWEVLLSSSFHRSLFVFKSQMSTEFIRISSIYSFSHVHVYVVCVCMFVLCRYMFVNACGGLRLKSGIIFRSSLILFFEAGSVIKPGIQSHG